jgi:hypothetical protein
MSAAISRKLSQELFQFRKKYGRRVQLEVLQEIANEIASLEFERRSGSNYIGEDFEILSSRSLAALKRNEAARELILEQRNLRNKPNKPSKREEVAPKLDAAVLKPNPRNISDFQKFKNKIPVTVKTPVGKVLGKVPFAKLLVSKANRS